MNSIKIKISLWFMVGLLNFCFSQDEQIDRPPNINDVQGVWQMKFDNYYEDFYYIKGNKFINISYNNEDGDYVYISNGGYKYLGLLSNFESKQKSHDISKMSNKGFYFAEYYCKSAQLSKELSPYLVRQFTYNGLGTDGEMEKVDGYPNFIGFVNGRGQWEIYNQIPYIPIHVLVALKKNNPKDYEFLIKFLDIDFKTITVQKSIIHSAPNQPTQMYLIKGDEVEFLEEQGEWYKIRFYGKKTIEGWIRKSDVE